jgi:hypothetical protein
VLIVTDRNRPYRAVLDVETTLEAGCLLEERLPALRLLLFDNAIRSVLRILSSRFPFHL